LARIAAVGDIHSPKFLHDFKAAMISIDCSSIDLFLLAGDVILKGHSENISDVLNIFEEDGVTCPIIGCFGNEEYSDIREQIRASTENRIRFLDDESIVLEAGGLNIGIVGTQGSLEMPTPWQARNIPNIANIYDQRISRISELLTELEADTRILLTHYPPTYKVLEGERTTAYPHIGCQKCERILTRESVDAVICAHSHMGIPFAVVKSVPIYNVSLPVVHKISLIELSEIKTIA
jgi:Icc-related predicted phosphoesterase